jgi:hypothetical protein
VFVYGVDERFWRFHGLEAPGGIFLIGMDLQPVAQADPALEDGERLEGSGAVNASHHRCTLGHGTTGTLWDARRAAESPALEELVERAAVRTDVVQRRVAAVHRLIDAVKTV